MSECTCDSTWVCSRCIDEVMGKSDHTGHGAGTEESGPDEPDCPCRMTPEMEDCAAAGCGFCLVQLDHYP